MIDMLEAALTPEQWDSLYVASARPPSIWTERRLLEHFTKRLPKDSSVLLLGSGAGTAAVALGGFRSDLQWHGVDFSAEAIAVAASRLEWASLMKVDLSVTPWPFADKQFGAVIASEILEYLPDPPKALAECGRIAELVVAATFSRDKARAPGQLWQFEPLDPWRHLPKGHIQVHHLQEGKLLLGFVDLK